jgi:flagellar biosynthetic protein FliP
LTVPAAAQAVDWQSQASTLSVEIYGTDTRPPPDAARLDREQRPRVPHLSGRGAIMSVSSLHPADAPPAHRCMAVWRFVRHATEMTVAMMLGMCVLGAVFRQVHLAVFGTGFEQAWHQHPELTSLAMAFNMTVPMVAWMHYRGHSWQRGGEMAAAMFMPAIVLIPMFWLGAVPAAAVLPMEMAAMMPAMIGAMLIRHNDYTAPAHGRRRTRA